MKPPPLLRLLLALGLTLGASACATTYPNLDPTGQAFPAVVGEDLEARVRHLPAEHAGKPILYLVGTVQETQFDIDRWLLGLLQAETPLAFLEVPTIPGLVPSLFLEETINQGMRDGIPSEDWGGVVTLYEHDAERVVRFTGNERPGNARALLLDAQGRVLWFHDRGYSPRVLLELDRLARSLAAAPAAEGEPQPE